MIRVAAIGFLCTTLVVSYWFADPERFSRISDVFAGLISRNERIDQNAFESAALGRVNALRAQLSQRPVAVSDEIQVALQNFAATRNRLGDTSLNAVFKDLQKRFPGLEQLSATMLFDPSVVGLLEGLDRWKDTTHPEFEQLNTLVFRDGLRQGCIAVLSRRLPAFDLETANREGGRFHKICPHCGAAHAIEFDRRHSDTLILSCPNCGVPYDVIASDTGGHFRRATDFLESFRLPETEAYAKLPEQARLLAIWSAVIRACDYEYDAKNLKLGEAWRTPSQTWTDKRGDCEDTSLLLADALLSAGIEARVAVGWNQRIGSHAWCVARVGGEQFVLESTLRADARSPDPKLLTVAAAAGEYLPEQLFDREALYFRPKAKAVNDRPPRCDDYWDAAIWSELRP
ncbi:MAG: hypothetical protein H7A53_07905 [Akkermansiaceae bacterium]|nr:hypothetical protein [Akkermansiaceae bacterium]